MNSSKFNYVTVNEILADVLKVVKDSDFRLNSPGWYTSQIQQALEELAFETYFDERTIAVDIPANKRVEMPQGAFNIKDLYLFNGDECVIGRSQPVHYKKNFISSKSGQGYVANQKGDNGTDRIMKKTFDQQYPRNLYFYAVQNGEIMLSSNAGNFEKLFIVYNGTGGNVGDAPFIPLFLRQAVKDYVTVAALEVKVAEVELGELNRWNAILAMHKGNLERDYTGSWDKAQKRVKKLDFKERKEIKERMQKMH